MSTQGKEEHRELSASGPVFHVLVGDRQYLVVHANHIWQPPTDVIEDGDRLLVLVEVAGMQAGEFEVSVSDRRLTIAGVRTVPVRPRAAYHRLEIRQGEFRTDVILPWTVQDERIEASYEDGFLIVELPRSKPEHVRVVHVNKTSSG